MQGCCPGGARRMDDGNGSWSTKKCVQMWHGRLGNSASKRKRQELSKLVKSVPRTRQQIRHFLIRRFPQLHSGRNTSQHAQEATVEHSSHCKSFTTHNAFLHSPFQPVHAVHGIGVSLHTFCQLTAEHAFSLTRHSILNLL